jgi:hypothetical protein
MKRIFTFAIILLLACASSVMGAKVGGVTLPDSYVLNGEKLMLNGTALRKKFFIKVYAGALYSPIKISDAKSAYQSDMSKVIRMHFIYKDVPGEKIKKTYIGIYEKEGFNYKNSSEAQKFLSFFSKGLKTDDIIDLIFSKNGKLQIKYNNRVVKEVNSEELCVATLKAYIGEYALEALRVGFLNK